MTKAEHAAGREPVRHSGFVILSSFGFRHCPELPHVGCYRVMNDLKFAFRQLLKSPGFTAVAVLTLALGIGANTIVFSWIRAVLFDAVPGARQADRLVVLCPRHTSGRIDDTMSFLDNRDLAAETDIFTGVAGSAYDAASLRVGDTVDWVWQESATANFFDLLGVEPALGRFFLPEEDTHPGGDNVAVLSHGLWQRRFGG